MKYTIVIYETARPTSARAPTSAGKEAYWGAYRAYTQALRPPASSSAAAGLQPPRRAPPSACATASGRSRTARSPRPRSSSAASTSSTCRTSTPRSTGRRAVPRPRPARSRCGRSGRCAMAAEMRTAARASRRAGGARRPTAGSSPILVGAHARRGGRRGRAGRRVRRGARHWPRDGVPEQPGGLAARRGAAPADRRRPPRPRRRPSARRRCCWLADERRIERRRPGRFPDERLEAAVRLRASRRSTRRLHTPLMLQTVLGLDAARIASAFLVAPGDDGPAAGAREDEDPRRRHRLRGARGQTSCRARLDAVLEAIYAAYGSGWEDVAGADARRRGPGRRGDLARPAARRAAAGRARGAGPARADALLRGAARRAARRATAAYVPLSEQDVDALGRAR